MNNEKVFFVESASEINLDNQQEMRRELCNGYEEGEYANG